MQQVGQLTAELGVLQTSLRILDSPLACILLLLASPIEDGPAGPTRQVPPNCAQRNPSARWCSLTQVQASSPAARWWLSNALCRP